MTQYTIGSSEWTQISNPGESIECWIDPDNNEGNQAADIRILQSIDEPAKSDATKGRQLFVPRGNQDTYKKRAKTEFYSFWAIAKNSNTSVIQVETDSGAIDTVAQDNTSQQVNLYLNKELSVFVLSGIQTIGSFTLNVESGHGIVLGTYSQYVCIQQEDTERKILRFFQARIVSVGATTLEVSRPIDFAFDPAKVLCSRATRVNMSGEVGTTASPVIYRIAPKYGAWHIYQLHFSFFSPSGTMDDGTFGTIAKLTYGITIRRNDGYLYNIINIRSNGELLGYGESSPGYSPKPPAGTGAGFTGTISLKDGNGSVPMLKASDEGSLEVVIPESLALMVAGSSFEIKAEGHQVVGVF